MENKNIYQSLLEAQKEIGAIKKDSDNPYFHSKYVDINGILAAVKPVLNKHGLVLIQPLCLIDGRQAIKTIIIDAVSKELLEYAMFFPEVTKPQDMGSLITYYRRYGVQSFLALEAEDDDGNAANGNVKKSKDSGKHDDSFMQTLEPTPEEISLWKVKMENCKDLKSLQDLWKSMAPMVKDKLSTYKEELKFKLS